MTRVAPHVASAQLPDGFETVDEIPRAAVGTFGERASRELFAREPAVAS